MPDLTELFAWTETDEDGYEGVIVAFIPFIQTFGPLQHHRRDVALQFAPIAQQHADKTGHRVRLVRFVRAETVKGESV